MPGSSFRSRSFIRRRRSRGKRSRKSSRSSSGIARSIRMDLSMLTPSSTNIIKGPMVERNGVASQKARSRGRKTNKRIKHNDLVDLICPLYKYRYDGYGYNLGFLHESATANAAASYNSTTQITTMGRDNLALPKGIWKSCEWSAGSQHWFEHVALPFYKKMQNGSLMSLVGLIRKYDDIRNTTAFSAPSISASYVAPDSLNNESTLTLNALNRQVNVCYNGGTQTHEFINFGINEITLELWELVPRRPLQGYAKLGSSGGAGTLNNYYKHQTIWEDLCRDNIENAPVGNAISPTYDQNANDEPHDVGFRINPTSGRIHFKYKVSKPVLVKLSPGAKFTYEMSIPAFEVSGSEWLEYLYTSAGLQDTVGNDNNETREDVRPSYIPKFTKVLCGRIYAQKGFEYGTDATKPDGNTSDVSWIKNVGYMGGMVAHSMSEYHSIRIMPELKRSNYQKMNYTDTDAGIINFIDQNDDELLTFTQSNNDGQDTSNALTAYTSP